MNGEVIKSFLVGLGFGVDDASLAAFNKAILSATLKVTALYATIKAASAGIFYSMSKISEGFEEVGYSLRLVAPAINKFLILRNAMLDAYSKAGINLTKVVQQSILFNYSLAKTKFALEAIYKSVAARFFPILTKQMDIFRQKIFANMPKIQATLEKFIQFVFRAFDITVQLGSRLWSVLGRVWDFLKKLDEATGGWSTKLLLIVAAWKLLNLSFLATPLGMLLTGLLALIALYDDFKVWQNGGEAFFNWGSDATKTVLGLGTAIGGLVAVIGGIQVALKLWAAAQWLVNVAMAANPIGLIIAGVALLTGLLTALAVKLGYLKGVGDFFSGLGSKVENLLGGPGANAALSTVTQPNQTPLASNSSNSNVKMNQENTTNFYGVPGASEAASSFADTQQRQNAELMRYLSGVNGLPVTR